MENLDVENGGNGLSIDNDPEPTEKQTKHASIWELRSDRREKREELRAQARHDAEMEREVNRERREQESHEASLENDAQINQVGLALLGGLAELTPVLKQWAEVELNKAEFGDRNAIRAAACGLIKKAAEEDGSVEAKQAAAKELLRIANLKLTDK